MTVTVSPVTPTPTNRTATALTFVLTDVGATFAIDDMIVICIAADNAGSGGAAANVSNVADSKGNAYSRPLDFVFDNGAANAGVENCIAYARITTALVSTDDITISFTVTTPSVAVTIWKLAHDGTVRAAFVSVGGGGTGATTGTPTTTTSGATPVAGDILIGHLAAETNVAVTADADTLNGSWSAQQTAVANTGTLLTSIRSATQAKTITVGAHQTYNPTLTSCDTAIGYAWFRPETIPQPAKIGYPLRTMQAVQRASRH